MVVCRLASGMAVCADSVGAVSRLPISRIHPPFFFLTFLFTLQGSASGSPEMGVAARQHQARKRKRRRSMRRAKSSDWTTSRRSFGHSSGGYATTFRVPLCGMCPLVCEILDG